MTDLFEMEFATDPQISPDGKTIVYVRNQFDIMNDSRRTDLWTIDSRGQHLPLFSGKHNYSSPRWSPKGDRLAFVSNENDRNQIFCYWVDSGRKAQLTNLNQAPGSLDLVKRRQVTLFLNERTGQEETFRQDASQAERGQVGRAAHGHHTDELPAGWSRLPAPGPHASVRDQCRGRNAETTDTWRLRSRRSLRLGKKRLGDHFLRQPAPRP